MSDTGGRQAPLLGIGGAIVLVGGLGALIGAIVAPLTWVPEPAYERDFWTLLSLVVIGLVSGGLIGGLISGLLGWHGSLLGATLDRGDMAPAAGALTGLLGGVSAGPILGGVFGVVFGSLVGGGLLVPFVLFGLCFGAVGGVAAWQIGFWAADLQRATGAGNSPFCAAHDRTSSAANRQFDSP